MVDYISNLQRNPIHRALSRPNLLLGADRELVLISGLATLILIFVALTVTSALSGAGLWMICITALRLMAKADPMMRRVYIRHISYHAYYRATPTPWQRY
jgi:type IV secretion system protein TrbD